MSADEEKANGGTINVTVAELYQACSMEGGLWRKRKAFTAGFRSAWLGLYTSIRVTSAPVKIVRAPRQGMSSGLIYSIGFDRKHLTR